MINRQIPTVSAKVAGDVGRFDGGFRSGNLCLILYTFLLARLHQGCFYMLIIGLYSIIFDWEQGAICYLLSD